MQLSYSAELIAQEIHTKLKLQSYLWDPVAWAEDVLGVVLWSKQKEIMRSVAANPRTAVKSCHSIGKTFISALLACWWIATRNDCSVQSTAPTYRQVHGLLWEEIRKMHAQGGLPGTINGKDQWTKEVYRGRGSTKAQVGQGSKPADGNIHGFHGVHRPDGVFCILDEACGIVPAIYNGAEAITTFPGDRLFTVGNPDDPNTKMGEVFLSPTGTWNLITVSAFDTPWFTGEAEEMIEKAKHDPALLEATMALLDHMPNPEKVEEWKLEWGVESATYSSKVLAEFPEVGSDSFFSQTAMDQAWSADFDDDLEERPILGIDLAGWGDDDSVVYLNRGGRVRKFRQWSEGDATIGVENVVEAIKASGCKEVRIDGGGLGGPIFDFLVHRTDIPDDVVVIKILGGEASSDNSVYANARTEHYNNLRHMMRTGQLDLEFEDERLKKQLQAIKYKFNAKGAMIIESKRDMRARGVKSPDELDAVVYATLDTSRIDDAELEGTVVEFDMEAEFGDREDAYSWGW